MAYSTIFATFILAFVMKDRVLSCSLRAHNNSGRDQPSTTKSTSISSHTSAANDSSLTPNRDNLNTTANTSLINSSYQNPTQPLFVSEPHVEPISSDENQILMQLLLQRLHEVPIYERVPIQSPFSSPISVYQPTSKFPDFIQHTLLQQIGPSSTSLKSRYSNVETVDPELLNRILPSSSSYPTFTNNIAIPNAVTETEPIVTPDGITTFSSNTSTSPTAEPNSASDQEFVNSPTPNTVLKNDVASTDYTQSSSLPCPECNLTSSTTTY